MHSVDCATVSPLNQKFALPHSAFPQSAETEHPADQASKPAISPAKRSNGQVLPEILVPGKDWEYVAEFSLSDLKTYPKQKDLFVGLNEAGIAELAEDIEKRGLQNPIEILPDGSIINGSQRFLAYELLGRKQIPVYIRRDFVNLPETAVNEHIVQDNLQRKHLHPLEIARGYVALRQLFREQAGADSPFTLRELRSDLARRFNISGRTLDRYVAALKAPPIIQDACIRGVIAFHAVCKIGNLSDKLIAELMARLAAGEDLVALVKEYTLPRRREQDPAVKALLALTRQFKRTAAEIEENIDQLPYQSEDLQECQPVLAEALDLLTSLLKCYKNPPVHKGT